MSAEAEDVVQWQVKLVELLGKQLEQAFDTIAKCVKDNHELQTKQLKVLKAQLAVVKAQVIDIQKKFSKKQAFAEVLKQLQLERMSFYNHLKEMRAILSGQIEPPKDSAFNSTWEEDVTKKLGKERSEQKLNDEQEALAKALIKGLETEEKINQYENGSVPTKNLDKLEQVDAELLDRLDQLHVDLKQSHHNPQSKYSFNGSEDGYDIADEDGDDNASDEVDTFSLIFSELNSDINFRRDSDSRSDSEPGQHSHSDPDSIPDLVPNSIPIKQAHK